MIDKTLKTCAEAVSRVFDGATVMLGGFGDPGLPGVLIEALREHGAKDLWVIHNGAGQGDYALAGLMDDGRVRKLTCSFPSHPGNKAFANRYMRGEIELELVPQGTLCERIRAAGAGLGGFFTPTGAGTELAAGKETRMINGREHVFEMPLSADFAFVRAYQGDRLGNLTYRMAMLNFNVPMCTAAKHVVAEIDELVPAGGIDPQQVHTPGIFVDHVVHCARHPVLASKVNLQNPGRA
ncbi:MAG: 3-oxoacid CoA-transferase subunit A [Gammaproteobacteria bacterium]|nr:MAG: 3-oxoacid CoA-transferase subunit A [Gammaproteobacteria bacterium]